MITSFYIACLLLTCLLAIATATAWMIIHSRPRALRADGKKKSLPLLPNRISSL